MSESTELTTVEDTPEGVVAVRVKTKNGTPATAYVPAELAERYPSMGQADELAELLAEVFGDRDESLSVSDLPRAKVPSGESKSFQIGDDDPVKKIRGIMIVRQERRNYWAKSISEGGGGQAPNCYSRDGVHGVGINGPGSADNPTGLCEHCPLSQWSENGEDRVPPPCKPQEAVLLLTEDSAFPLLLTVPRTSQKALRDYVKRTLLAKKMKSPVEVVTEIGMRQEQNAEKVTYNILTFEIAEDITAGMTPAEKRAYKLAPLALGEQFRTILASIDTSRDTEAPERQAEDEGGFSLSDEPVNDVVGEYAGQTAG